MGNGACCSLGQYDRSPLAPLNQGGTKVLKAPFHAAGLFHSKKENRYCPLCSDKMANENTSYTNLLISFPPRPIKSEEDFEKTQVIVDKLLDKGELTEEEEDYLFVHRNVNTRIRRKAGFSPRHL